MLLRLILLLRILLLLLWLLLLWWLRTNLRTNRDLVYVAVMLLIGRWCCVLLSSYHHLTVILSSYCPQKTPKRKASDSVLYGLHPHVVQYVPHGTGDGITRAAAAGGKDFMSYRAASAPPAVRALLQSTFPNSSANSAYVFTPLNFCMIVICH